MASSTETSSTDTPPADARPADTVIIGGGASGLSAAMALGRSRRSVVVVDAGQPRNAPAQHMHGVLGHDGTAPGEFLALGRKELDRYDVTVVEGRAVGAERGADGTFAVELDDGRTFTGRRLLAATGVVDELPDVPGLRARWGRDVIHCPYCHGWEVQGRNIAVLATGPLAGHQALLFRQLSPTVTMLTNGTPIDPDELTRLRARGIGIADGTVTGVVIDDDVLIGATLDSGTTIAADVVVVAPRMVAAAEVLASLGIEPTAHAMGPGIGSQIEVSEGGTTSVPGLYATGNVTDLMHNVTGAVAHGFTIGAMINADLVTADTDHAIESSVELPVMDQAFWDDMYGGDGQLWSGSPNPHLVADLGALTPGRALDVGAGEGADAIWLAEQGWNVTAVDISPLALERGAAEAATRAPGVADRITWTPLDVLNDAFPAGPFDLVTAHFMHFTLADRVPFHQRCLDAVAPGGAIQIVGHHPADLDVAVGRFRVPDALFTPGEMAALFDADWQVEVQETRTRTIAMADHDHSHSDSHSHDSGGLQGEATIRDTVLVANRLR